MRNVIAYMSMSLDGFVGSDREHPGVAIADAEVKQWKLDRISQAGAHLMGRVDLPGDVVVLARVGRPVRRADERHPQDRVLPDAHRRRGELAGHPGRAGRPGDRDRRHQVRARLGRHRLGRCRFAGALAAADLIDEYRLLVQPLVLGRGQALFEQLPESRHLDLLEATPFPSGIIVQIYRPQRS